MKRMIKTMLCLAVLCTSASAQTEQRTLNLDVNKLGIEISPTLSGIFFENINQSLDGGICAQMIHVVTGTGSWVSQVPVETWYNEQLEIVGGDGNTIEQKRLVMLWN